MTLLFVTSILALLSPWEIVSWAIAMVAIEKASEMSYSLGLKRFQDEGHLRLYLEYLDNNKRRNRDSLSFEVCPNCGKVNPHIIKGGMPGNGKQMYSCSDCGRRFVYDIGTFSFYSH